VGAGIKKGGGSNGYSNVFCVLEYDDGEVVDSVEGDCPQDWLDRPDLLRVWEEDLSEGDVAVHLTHVVIARQQTTSTTTTSTTTTSTTTTSTTTTSTTTTSTTTTARPSRPTTTTSGAPTTVASTTEPTVLGTEAVAATQPAPTTTVAVLAGELPRTGPDASRPLVLGGLALMLGGVILLAAERLPASARSRPTGDGRP
jgi:LPXTG-motif cell wall-anchored protein